MLTPRGSRCSRGLPNQTDQMNQVNQTYQIDPIACLASLARLAFSEARDATEVSVACHSWRSNFEPRTISMKAFIPTLIELRKIYA